VLRDDGRLTLLVNGTLTMLCSSDSGDKPEERLQQDYFGMHRFEWPDWPSVEFHLGYGDWIRLLRRNGFEIEDLIEIQAREGATTTFEDQVTPEWARRWPSEEVWKARKR
jgi:hypothetical protein